MLKRYLNRSHLLSLCLILALASFPFATLTTASAQHLTWDGWTQETGQPGEYLGQTKILTDANNNVFLTGTFKSNAYDFDPTSNEDIHSSYDRTGIFVSKYTSSGTYLWTQTWSSENYGSLFPDAMTVTSSGNIAITASIFEDVPPEGNLESTVDLDPGDGTTIISASNHAYTFFLFQISNDGDFQWGHTANYANDLDSLSNGTIVATSSSNNSITRTSSTGTVLGSTSNAGIDYARTIVDSNDGIHIWASYNNNDVVFDPTQPQHDLETQDSNGALADSQNVILNYSSAGVYQGVTNLGIYSHDGDSATNCCARTTLRQFAVDSENNMYAYGIMDGDVGINANPGPADPSADLDENGNYIFGPYQYSDGTITPFLARVNSDGTLGNFLPLPENLNSSVYSLVINSSDQVMTLSHLGITTYSFGSELGQEPQTVDFIDFLGEYVFEAQTLALGPNDEMYTASLSPYYKNPVTGERSTAGTQMSFTRWGVSTPVDDPITIEVGQTNLDSISGSNEYLAPGETATYSFNVQTTSDPEVIDSLTFDFSDTENFRIESVTPSQGSFDMETSTWTNSSALDPNHPVTFTVVATALVSGVHQMGTFAAEVVGAHLSGGTREISQNSAVFTSLQSYINDIEPVLLFLSSNSFEGATAGQATTTRMNVVNNSDFTLDELHFSFDATNIDLTSVTPVENDEAISADAAADRGSFDLNSSTWTGQLDPNQAISFDVTGTVTGDPSESLSVNIEVGGASGNGVTHPISEWSTTSATSSGYINFLATDLALSSEFVSEGDIHQGDDVSFTETITNLGPHDTGYDADHYFATYLFTPPEFQFSGYTSDTIMCMNFGPLADQENPMSDYFNTLMPGYSLIMCAAITGSAIPFPVDATASYTINGTATSDFTGSTRFIGVLLTQNLPEADLDGMAQLGQVTDLTEIDINNINSLTYAGGGDEGAPVGPDPEATTTTTAPGTTSPTTTAASSPTTTTSDNSSATTDTPSTTTGQALGQTKVDDPNVPPVAVKDDTQRRTPIDLTKSVVAKAVQSPWLLLGIFSLTGSNVWDTVILITIFGIIALAVFMIRQESKKTKALNQKEKS